MQKKRKLLAMLCATLIFTMAFAPIVQAAPTAKQLIIEYIESSDLFESGVYNQVNSKMYTSSAGSYNVKILDLNGELASESGFLESLSGAALDMDYKLNSANKQFELDYDLKMNREKYQGVLYSSDDVIILTAQSVVDLLRLLSESDGDTTDHSLLSVMEETPQYFYSPIDEMYEINDVWSALSHQGEVPPALKDFLVYLVEATPDKYFSFSLIDQSFVFSLDSAGLADVVHAFMEKAIAEPERLADMIADLRLYTLPETEREMVSAELKADIVASIQDTDEWGLPDVAEIQQGIEEVFILNSLSLEKSILGKKVSFSLSADLVESDDMDGYILIDYNVEGSEENYHGSATCNAYYAEEYFGAGSLSLKMSYNGNQEQLDGDYELYASLMDDYDDSIAEFEAGGTYNYTLTSEVSRNIIKASARTGDVELLGLSLSCDFSAQYDPDLVIELPELTPTNSVNLELLDGNDSLLIYVDGKPLNTHRHYGQTLVPLRELAETVGCQVEWIEPDEIIITRDDVTAVIHLYRWSYEVNGEELGNSSPPILIEDRTMAPFWLITDAFGCSVSYSYLSNTVNIRTE